MSPKNQNKRKHPRVPLNMFVQFKSENYDGFMEEYAPNISAGGMFIRSVQPREKGTTLFFQFTLEDNGPLIEGMAKVVHVNQAGCEGLEAGMGLEFVSMDSNSKEKILGLISDRFAN